MSTRMIARRTFAVSVVAGADDVIAGAFLPSGSILNSVRGKVGMVSSTQLVGSVTLNALEGWILPVLDPDAAATMNAIFDALVPKDTTANTMDLDTAAADASAFHEPGLIAWEMVVDVGKVPRRIYHQHRVLNSAMGALVVARDPETPFLFEAIHGNVYDVNVGKRYRVTTPSVVVFAVAAPDTAATSATDAVAGIAENEWFQIKYIDHVLERAMISLFGLTEAGAESPWDEASQLLRKHLEPQMLEDNAGTFVGTNWSAAGEMIFDHTVVGRIGQGLISTGR